MSVQTVLGPVKSSDLGVTLTHEHFNLNFEEFYKRPPHGLENMLKNGITLQNVGYVKQYPYSCQTNIRFFGNDVDSAILDELKSFRKFGGGCIVENTTHGLGRNIALMVKASQETGVHVVAGTGHYVAAVQSPKALKQTVEQLCSTIRKDITEGCEEYPTVKCGVIGEVGSAWPILDFEKKAIEAAGIMQEETGCAVSFHPGRAAEAPGEILRIYLEAGGKIAKANMSHLDRTIKKVDQLLDFADIGSYCQFDLFGTECSFYQLNAIQDMPSDAQRIDKISELISNGKIDKILVSHDIHTKHRLVNFGGHGFSHLLTNVASQMEYKGLKASQIKQIMTCNPSKWLSVG